MFNLDEIDVDFTDATFGILNSKFASVDKQSTEKGILSIGVCSDQIGTEHSSPKKRCLSDQLSDRFIQKPTELKHINRNIDKFPNNNKPFTFKQINVVKSSTDISYLPFTSTQKSTGVNVQGCFFDSSNVISPIKSKSQMNFYGINDSNLGYEKEETFSSDKKSYSYKSQNKGKFSGAISLPSHYPASSNQISTSITGKFTHDEEINKCYNQNKNQFSDSFSLSYSPITSTQKVSGSNKFECLFNDNNPISPIKIKPGICSELRKLPTKFSESKDLFNKFKTRKFPGPAGCLPKVDNFENYSIVGEIKELKFNNAVTTRNELSNVSSINNFTISSQSEQSETWKRARNLVDDSCWSVFQEYTIQNVLKKVSEPKGFFNSKIPVICLALTEIEYLSMDAAAKMSDITGSIKCAIHRQVLEKYNEKIKTGSIFILKEVSIFSPSGKKFYLNIIQSNIIEIINPDSEITGELLISKHDIDAIIKQCSEVPTMNFDPSSAYDDVKVNAPHSNKPGPSNSEIKEPNPPSNNNDDLFDDGMDEFFASFMDE